ncbi:hypothetical protein QBC32DRAFT_259514 [Pseudoneurospora amorphoporcata]|uniref:Mid2 domain-containing protein n=1 Tax=Pseudoneurospora amorphoporcata TaxID=241081 RepID=A0AAN6NV56_9PEZI|nr:hypothetical protein QBC32DRAFT_259514 [Pseudoneurospora amorphoporcata]
MDLKTTRTILHFAVRISFFWSCVVTHITAHSTFPDDYEGIYSPVGQPTSVVNCAPDAIFTTWSTFANCCPSTYSACEFVTRCDGGVMHGIEGGTGHCDSTYPNCYTMTIFDHYLSPSNSWIEMGCATGWSAFTIYRELEASTTSTSTSTSTSSTPTTTLSASTSEPSLTSVITPSTSNPPPPLPTSTQEPKPSSSKAWIAGPVAGGIAALLLLGALFFWWRRRKNAQETNEGPAMAQSGTAGGYQPEYVGSPHNTNHTPQQYGPSGPPSAPYYPPNSPPHYGSSSPPLHDASNASQYNYAASGTPNTMSWQGSPRPVSEQDPMGKQYQPFRPQIAEAP